MMDIDISETVNYLDILDTADQKALESFQYSGSDDSILYKLFYSPFSQYLVDNYIPERFTPNSITLVGLSFVLIPHLLIILTAMDDDQVPATYCYYANAIGTFCYLVSFTLSRSWITSMASRPGRLVSLAL